MKTILPQAIWKFVLSQNEVIIINYLIYDLIKHLLCLPNAEGLREKQGVALIHKGLITL